MQQEDARDYPCYSHHSLTITTRGESEKGASYLNSHLDLFRSHSLIQKPLKNRFGKSNQMCTQVTLDTIVWPSP